MASLVLWGSFAWGSPDPAAAGDEGTPAVGGEPATEPREFDAWLYGGAGLGAAGFAGNGALNVKYGRFLAAVCATTDGAFTWGTTKKHKDIGFLLGYYPFKNLGVAAGVTWVEAAELGEAGGFFNWGEWEYSYTAGVPVEVRYGPWRSRVVGLALVGHVNFNDEEIFASITAGIELGKLK